MSRPLFSKSVRAKRENATCARRVNFMSARRGLLAALVTAFALSLPAVAQQPEGWDAGVNMRSTFPSPSMTDEAAPQPQAPSQETAPSNVTVVPRTGGGEPGSSGTTPINLIALLTADGQRIDQGLVWRIYENSGGTKRESKLLATHREASPTVNLKPGDYIINAAFGRADLTRAITVAAGGPTSEKFVLNAGGLRVKVLVDGAAPAANAVRYDIYSGERDQSDNRTRVLTHVKPNTIIRLNAGIYRIVSTYGDANATVEADINVEAGKLTEATVSHTAAHVTFKLVTRIGGEALPDTQWTIQTPQGEVVKRSVGALPTHILAPGTYTIIAKSGTRAFKRDFTLAGGETAQVEVLMR
jgi:hypothetical protein